MPPFFWAWAMTCRAKRRLAAGLRAEDLDDAPAGQTVAPQGDVQREAAGGDAGHGALSLDAQGHDRPFAKLLFDLGDGRFQRRMRVEHPVRHRFFASALESVFAGEDGFLAMRLLDFRVEWFVPLAWRVATMAGVPFARGDIGATGIRRETVNT